MEKIIREGRDPDAWVCVCGNTPTQEGFHPCDGRGEELEPTPTKWKKPLYVCARCGRIIDQETLHVVGTNSQKSREHMLFEAHVKELTLKNADVWNLGWCEAPNLMESKTSKGILHSEIHPRTQRVTHRWHQRNQSLVE